METPRPVSAATPPPFLTSNLGADDLKKILGEVGVTIDDALLNKVIELLAGKPLHEVIAAGMGKLQTVSFGSGGGGGGAGGEGAAAVEVVEEKEVSEKEDVAVGGFFDEESSSDDDESDE